MIKIIRCSLIVDKNLNLNIFVISIAGDKFEEFPFDSEDDSSKLPDYGLSLEIETEDAWVQYGTGILNFLLNQLKREAEVENKNHINPYYCETLPDKILKDMVLFALWGCITHGLFNYGSIPASTSEAENTNHLIRQHVARKDECPMNVKTFMFRHAGFLSSTALLANAAALAEEKRNEQAEKQQGCENETNGNNIYNCNIRVPIKLYV